MPLTDGHVEGRMFFGDPRHDDELPTTNEAFWSALVGHIELDWTSPPRVILDVGCHTGGLLEALSRRFAPNGLFGIEPLAAARSAAARRLDGAAATVSLLDATEWDRIPTGGVDLGVSHEMLYLEPDVPGFMGRIRRVLGAGGIAYIVLGCHAENPLWQTWKTPLIAAGHRVYDHMPIEIMEAASAAGMVPSVQPLRRSGWITYDPLHAEFRYPSIRAMLDHHYLYKLLFRLEIANDGTGSS
ncbi:MAG TPA: class I SAM-dependent methyltransferase [Longimicrobiaceae bacterium]|nr:class I SAM-dependent methyltransferase [Longimicrobiaceae bacterium]